MIGFLIARIVTVILDALSVRFTTDPDKDLELLVLRQQIRILERRVTKPVRPTRIEKLLAHVNYVCKMGKLREREEQQATKNAN
ncbi:MAG: hypothetical protein ABI947_19805 [Chloroflexota bacterium]